MIPNMPTIGARFDIEKAGSGYYGFTCWKVFWQAINPEEIGVASLYEGDTAATLNGRENAFCIAVQSLDSRAIVKIKTALTESEQFKQVCANPMFVEGLSCAAEPLPDAGRIDANGNIVGDAYASRSAYDAVKKELVTPAEIPVTPTTAKKVEVPAATPAEPPTAAPPVTNARMVLPDNNEIQISEETRTLGRSDFVKYVSSEVLGFVSRQHLLISFENGKYYVADANSSNGTKVNGVLLKSDERYELKDSDLVVLGEVLTLVFRTGQVS
jgi:hypothetical protein